jgi:integrase
VHGRRVSAARVHAALGRHGPAHSLRNAAVVARKPRAPTPQPDPPTVAQAARIIEAAWAEDDDWGTLVRLVMVTGMRRAELLALRWSDVDFDTGTVTVRRNYVRVNRKSIEKDTKTHQMRRLALDSATVEVLTEHRARYAVMCRELGVSPRDDAFLFSYRPLHERPCDPSGVSHRYARMCAELAINSHLHALRHYSATELLSAGVDLRTVAGRLGHGGGGATTLRVYAAWVGEADRRAAELLSTRMSRPTKSGAWQATKPRCSTSLYLLKRRRRAGRAASGRSPPTIGSVMTSRERRGVGAWSMKEKVSR